MLPPGGEGFRFCRGQITKITFKGWSINIWPEEADSSWCQKILSRSSCPRKHGHLNICSGGQMCLLWFLSGVKHGENEDVQWRISDVSGVVVLFTALNTISLIILRREKLLTHNVLAEQVEIGLFSLNIFCSNQIVSNNLDFLFISSLCGAKIHGLKCCFKSLSMTETKGSMQKWSQTVL